MPTVAVYAHIVAESAEIDEIRSACEAIVDDVKAEDGCMTYHLLEGAEDANVIAWFERWRDDDAFQAHLKGSAAARLGKVLQGRLAEPMVITTHRELA